MRRKRACRVFWMASLALGPILIGDARSQEPLPPLPPTDAPPYPAQSSPSGHNHDATHPHAETSLIGKLNPFRPFDPTIPLTVPELCKRLDCLTEELRDDGLILLKQPDVYSQARLTRFRNDFDTQMSNDLGSFHLVLAARISRLDAATTTQTTALGAALAAPGTTNVAVPDASKFIGSVSGSNSPFQNTTSLFPTNGAIDPKNGAFGGLGLAPSTLAGAAGGGGTLALGVDPTVYLDEKKRFLDQLNQIRRINQGPDQNDSSGYGLYVVRMPVSIQPGECTYQGYGANLSLNVEHEFPPDFLPTTFQNLVINDLVDQLAPFIYEAIRTGAVDNDLGEIHDATEKQKALKIAGFRAIQRWLAKLQAAKLHAPAPKAAVLLAEKTRKVKLLTAFILRESRPLNGDPVKDRLTRELIAARLRAIQPAFDSAPACKLIVNAETILEGHFDDFRQGLGFTDDLHNDVEAALSPIVDQLLTTFPGAVDSEKIRPFLMDLYQTVMPEEVKTLDDLLSVPQPDRETFTLAIAAANEKLFPSDDEAIDARNNLALPTSRSPKQQYPIAPRELLDYFLRENIYAITNDANQASRTQKPNLLAIRAYIRQTLATAYAIMSRPTDRELQLAQADRTALMPLADPSFMDQLCETIRERGFNERLDPNTKGKLDQLNAELLRRLARGRKNLKSGSPIAALCWAIAVDAAVLDLYLRMDADKLFETKGVPANAKLVRFYLPKSCENSQGSEVFRDYVKHRWPIITFSLDPVNDQQNIADTFNLKRDLQLALSFAFSTGQINFNQLNTFRRQIEQSSDTIALNRTVTGFSYSNDNFGFRFTPRFQNPPNQRTNIGVIASQLISGGPGPDYQIKKSKLEPGMRELNAVLLIPDFLPTMRLNVDSNWFKLNDPEHLVFHTGRGMERGRRVQELRKAVLDACSSKKYRLDDLRVLQKKLAQLEAMLPMQSQVVQLPFDNMANGFDLLTEGSTALSPELTGFSGVDAITAPAATVVSAVAPAGATFPVPGSNGVQLQTTTSPTGTNQTISVVGGSTSIADVFVFGKFLNLLDTNVVAGGRSAAFQLLSREVMHVQIPANVIPTMTEDGNSYVEIYASTPNGISNTILIPFVPATPPTGPAYDLAAASSTVTVYYELLKGADATSNFVATFDPGKSKAISIGWDAPTGLAPKRLRILFTGKINNIQGFGFSMDADATQQDDYQIPALDFANTLLKNVQKVITTTGAVPQTLSLTLSAQQYTPNGADNYRVRTKPKVLPTTMNVIFQYLSVPELPKPPAPAAGADDAAGADGAAPDPAAGSGAFLRRQDGQPLVTSIDPTATRGNPKRDPGLAKTAQLFPSLPPLPQVPASLKLPQPPPVSSLPTLLAPNVANEAEQVARMLTGQPLPPNPTGGQTNTVIASATVPSPAAGGGGQGQPIIVMPAPVVVVPANEPPKKHGHDRQNKPSLLKRLGNRISNAMPGAGN